MTGWRVERSEDGEAVLTFGGLPFGQGFGLVASLGEQAPVAYAALADALARDAQVAEIVREWTAGDDGLTDSEADTEAIWAIAALCPSPGDRDDSEEQR